jgi:hypothetical protein
MPEWHLLSGRRPFYSQGQVEGVVGPRSARSQWQEPKAKGETALG